MSALTAQSRNAMLAYDTKKAISVTEKAAHDLLLNEKCLAEIPVIGEICPVGTLAKLKNLKELLLA